MPVGPRNKKVKGGGALTFAQGKVYRLKGSNTREFWRYTPEPVLPLKTEIETSPLPKTTKRSFGIPWLIISSPNPARVILNISYLPVNSTNSHLKIFDVAGTLRAKLNISNNEGKLKLPITYHQVSPRCLFFKT